MGKKLATKLVNEVSKFVDFNPLNYNLNLRTGDLRLTQTRKSFYTSNYYYAEPVSIACNFDHDYDSKGHFHYVVILEPLKILCTVPNIEHLLRLNKTVLMASLNLLMVACSHTGSMITTTCTL